MDMCPGGTRQATVREPTFPYPGGHHVKLTAFLAALLLGTTAMAQTPAPAAEAPKPAAPTFTFALKGFVSMSAAYQTGSFFLSARASSPSPRTRRRARSRQQLAHVRRAPVAVQLLREGPAGPLRRDAVGGPRDRLLPGLRRRQLRRRLAPQPDADRVLRAELGQPQGPDRPAERPHLRDGADVALAHRLPARLLHRQRRLAAPGHLRLPQHRHRQGHEARGGVGSRPQPVGRHRRCRSAARPRPRPCGGTTAAGGSQASGITLGEASGSPAVEGRVSFTYGKLLTAFVAAHYNQVDLTGVGGASNAAAANSQRQLVPRGREAHVRR